MSACIGCWIGYWFGYKFIYYNPIERIKEYFRMREINKIREYNLKYFPEELSKPLLEYTIRMLLTDGTVYNPSIDTDRRPKKCNSTTTNKP